MRTLVLIFVLMIVAFALGAQWYVSFDVYATQGADAANDYFGATICTTFIVAILGSVAVAAMDR